MVIPFAWKRRKRWTRGYKGDRGDRGYKGETGQKGFMEDDGLTWIQRTTW